MFNGFPRHRIGSFLYRAAELLRLQAATYRRSAVRMAERRSSRQRMKAHDLGDKHRLSRNAIEADSAHRDLSLLISGSLSDAQA